jgi:hypothetical protein
MKQKDAGVLSDAGTCKATPGRTAWRVGGTPHLPPEGMSIDPGSASCDPVPNTADKSNQEMKERRGGL